MATSSRIIGILREWAAPGEMIIRTISKRHTGGAMEKKDQPERMTDGPSVDYRFDPPGAVSPRADCVHYLQVSPERTSAQSNRSTASVYLCSELPARARCKLQTDTHGCERRPKVYLLSNKVLA
jgi:hypothetical protein